MKLIKAALILGIFAILTSSALAQDPNTIKLTDISNEDISYYCFGCNPQVDGREGSLVWYKCEKDTENCQISVRRTSDDHELTILKFNKARAYFENKKLVYITVDPSSTRPNAVPFDIAGIEIPYVSASDRINFGKANTVNGRSANPITEAYFQTFYYEAGSARAQVVNEMPTQNSVKRGETLPLSLCGQEFFDVTSELVLGKNRNSWFLVEKRGQDCIVSSYRVSTQTDNAWLTNHRNKGARTYPCGKNSVYFAALHFIRGLTDPEQETVLTNFECKAERDVARLQCPASGNQDEKRLCEEQTKNVLLQAGSTQYSITGGEILVLPADTNSQTTASTTIQINNAQNIKVFLQSKIFNLVPEGSTEIRFNGQLDDANPSGESRILIKKGRLNTKVNNRLIDYVLNRPENTPEQFRYSLVFEQNYLKSISEAGKEESNDQQALGGTIIIGLRIADNLRTAGRLPGNRVFNLFPLVESEANVRLSDSYIIYIVPRTGMTLKDIAKAQPGMSQLEGNQLADFMEQIRETSGLHYDDEGIIINPESRGPNAWTAAEAGTNNAFVANDVVLVPTGRNFQGTAGNTLTVTDDVPRSRQNVEQRAQRRPRRPGTDNSCISSGGECHDNAVEGVVCNLESGKDGKYRKNKCLSNTNSRYLCCLPPGDIVKRVGARNGIQCRQRGGQCTTVDETKSQNRVLIDTACDQDAKPIFAPNDPKKWRYYGTLDCANAGRENFGVCCGPGVSRTEASTPAPARSSTNPAPSTQSQAATAPTAPQITTPSTSIRTATTTPTPAQSRGTQCRTNDDCETDVRNRPFCQNGFCTACADRDGNNPRTPSYIAEVITVGSEIDLDECRIGPESNKYLEEKVCRNLGRLSTDSYDVVPDVVEWNCRIVMNNPGAMCLPGMTNKGMAGYCGIPDSSISKPEALTTSIRRGSV